MTKQEARILAARVFGPGGNVSGSVAMLDGTPAVGVGFETAGMLRIQGKGFDWGHAFVQAFSRREKWQKLVPATVENGGCAGTVQIPKKMDRITASVLVLRAFGPTGYVHKAENGLRSVGLRSLEGHALWQVWDATWFGAFRDAQARNNEWGSYASPLFIDSIQLEAVVTYDQATYARPEFNGQFDIKPARVETFEVRVRRKVQERWGW